MILLYRITPFFIGLVSIFGLFSLIFRWAHPVAVFIPSVILLSLLMARLLKWEAKTFAFWFFLGTALIFFISTFGTLLLFEKELYGILISLFSTIFLVLFTEYVFQFTHIPSRYQPFSLEYLSLLLNIITIFFTGSVGFGARLLLQTPLWILALLFFIISYFIVYGTLWVSKVDSSRAKPYAAAGAVLFTELFVALTFFPTGLYTNAAFITIFSYAFLGLTRSNSVHKLSRTVVKRYVSVAIVLILLISLSSQWI